MAQHTYMPLCMFTYSVGAQLHVFAAFSEFLAPCVHAGVHRYTCVSEYVCICVLQGELGRGCLHVVDIAVIFVSF